MQKRHGTKASISNRNRYPPQTSWYTWGSGCGDKMVMPKVWSVNGPMMGKLELSSLGLSRAESCLHRWRLPFGREIDIPRGFRRQRAYQWFSFTKRQIWLLDFLTVGWAAAVRTDKSHESSGRLDRNVVSKSPALVKSWTRWLSGLLPNKDSKILQLHSF